MSVYKNFNELVEARKRDFDKIESIFPIGFSELNGIGIKKLLNIDNKNNEAVKVSLERAFGREIEYSEVGPLVGLISAMLIAENPDIAEKILDFEVLLKELDKYIPGINTPESIVNGKIFADTLLGEGISDDLELLGI